MTPQTEHAADSGLAGEPLRLHVHKTRGAKLVATGLFEQGFCVCNRFSPKRTWGSRTFANKKNKNCSHGTATQHCTVSFEVRAASTVVDALTRDTLGITAHTGQPVSTVPGLMAPINTMAKRTEMLYWEGWA